MPTICSLNYPETLKFPLANFVHFPACKIFKNRLRFDKVTESLKVGTFLGHSVVLLRENSHAPSFNLQYKNDVFEESDSLQHPASII